MSELMPIREAQEKTLEAIGRKEPQTISVLEAAGRTLAEEIISPLDLPAFDNSSMDGFALRSSEIANASPGNPVTLPVLMDIPAGFAGRVELPVGHAARILTGAPIPVGADTVIPVEKTDQYQKPQNGSLPDNVTFLAASAPGDNIRRTGEDLKQGQLILPKGRLLQAQDLGLLVMMGIQQVSLLQRPRVAIFSSGNELLMPGEVLTPGKIYDANRHVLRELLQSAGAEVIDLGIARDTPQSVKAVLDQALSGAPDLIISSAGVSVGAFDYVRQVIEENGSLAFWRVNMRPGKPIAFGSYCDIPFIGLPGNPVSAFIGCKVFVEPCIRKLRGFDPFKPDLVKAVLDDPLKSPDGRESFYRGVIREEEGVLRARLTGHQGSGNLFSLVQANALLIVPAGVKKMDVGDEVNAWWLDTR